MHVLILGGTGMLGHKLCQRLPGEFRVSATIRQAYNLAAMYPDVYHRAELITGVDVLRERALEETLNALKPDAIVNCVGVVKQKAEAEDRYLSVAINAFASFGSASTTTAMLSLGASGRTSIPRGEGPK